jgi:hypothetical protein
MKIKELLTEYKASPNILISLASKINARVGIEFEMAVPNIMVAPEVSSERDDIMDARCSSIDQIVEFFDEGMYNSREEIRNLRTELESSFDTWWQEECDKNWKNYGKQNSIEKFMATTNLEGDEKDLVEENLYDEIGDEYTEIKDDWFSNEEDDKDINEVNWLVDVGLRWLSGVEEQYNLVWPYYIESEGDLEPDLDRVSSLFSKNVAHVAFTSDTYHGTGRSDSGYSIEPDSSIETANDETDAGLEFISPPMSFLSMNVDLAKIIAWASKYGCYTNSSTGLHINVSLPDFNKSKIDYTKLALMLGDNYILDQFGRGANTFCKPAIGLIGGKLATDPALVNQYLSNMKDKMSGFAIRVVSNIFADTPKYTSINLKTGYVEFRSPGGDWLHADINVLQATIARFIVALDAACNPEKMKHQYLKKLYILLSKYTTTPEEREYAQYVSAYLAGQLSQSALVQYFREIQAARISVTPNKKKLPLP